MQRNTVRSFFEKLQSADELKAALKGIDQPQILRDLLLTPLSASSPVNALSYAVDGYFSSYNFTYSSGNTKRKELVEIILDEVEKISDVSERTAMLVSSNTLGQTVFHQSLKFGGIDMFQVLVERLHKWAGDGFADSWLKDLIDTPLGKIDRDIAYALQNVRTVRGYDTPECEAVNELCCDRYKPATKEALKAAVDAIRPLIVEWCDKNAVGADGKPKTHQSLRDFASNPDAVQDGKSLLMSSFPGKAFDVLLDLTLKFDPKTPTEKAAYIFGLLSEKDSEGKTPMHISWQYSHLMGPPKVPGHVGDYLGPFIASLGQRFGDDAAITLTQKLLLLEDNSKALPMDKLEYGYDARKNERDIYLQGFLHSLRRELGTQEKFERYVREAVAPVLPADFAVTLKSYDIVVTKAGEDPKPARGARID